MSKQNENITSRVFNYNGVKLPDPGIEQFPTIDDVKSYYSSAYPELNNATTKDTIAKGVQTVTFKQNTGTRG